MSHARNNSIGAAVLAVVTVAAFLGAGLFQTREACATEFNIYAYRADPSAVARFPGCGDPAFARELLASPIVEEHALDRRFSDGYLEQALADFVAGRKPRNDAAEGFTLMMIAERVGRRDDQFYVGAPFVGLNEAKVAFRASGLDVLAELAARIDEGNIADGPGLPDALRGKLVHSDYPIRVSVIGPEDAARFAAALRAWDGAIDYDATLAAAEDEDYVDGDSATEMAEEMIDYVETLADWMERTVEREDTLFLFYDTF